MLYWFAAQQKIGLFDAKFSADFNELLSFLVKTTRSGQKMAKTKVVRKTPIGVAWKLRVKVSEYP